MQHVHVNVVEFSITLAYLIMAGFTLRTIQIMWPDSALAKALAFIF